MGSIKRHLPVKLIIGFIFQEESLCEKTQVLLVRRLGKIDFESTTLPFIHTDYYRKEFGNNLKRRFVSFAGLIPPQDIVKIKLLTNKLEVRLSCRGRRRINIDPGYLDKAKLVLASTKDYRHRIYLNKGIYAEITLFYQDRSFRPWEWTYPDYRTLEYIAIFNRIREIYAAQVENK